MLNVKADLQHVSIWRIFDEVEGKINCISLHIHVYGVITIVTAMNEHHGQRDVHISKCRFVKYSIAVHETTFAS
jgi:hypothetical protein